MAELTFAADSVIGNRYASNFDKYLADPVRRFAVVADGMGGSQGSDTAGTLAVEIFAAGEHDGPAALRACVAEAQRRVGEAGDRLRELTGCTLTALVAGDDDAWLVQIGDSRVYRLRDDVLELLTVDHTVAWLGAVHGWFPFDSAEARSARYRLLRYIGHPDHPEPDLMQVTLRPGDAYLLCTDGLAEQVPYDRIASVLAGPLPAAGKVRALLDDSLTAGGDDNATAILVEVAR